MAVGRGKSPAIHMRSKMGLGGARQRLPAGRVNPSIANADFEGEEAA